MDKDTRNSLSNTTQAVRRLLEEEFRLQLEGTFDVHVDGRIAAHSGAPLSDQQRLTRRKIVEAVLHRRSMGESDVESVGGFLRETSFTFLNRLAALKLMEARGLVLECVSSCGWRDGKSGTEAIFEARGFKEFSGLAPGLIELPDKGYRLFLECLFDEIGREVGILFDRTDTASLLWPRRKALTDVLTRLNDPDLAGVWSEDETIGWIYQYWNDPAERKKMRDESAAPRNSREMAVRNQFFTPRYVVEFLTDNALGRLWYEMTKGQTRLKDRCRYLIRRPVEFFLPAPPERAPEWLRDFLTTADFSRLPENPPETEVFLFLNHFVEVHSALDSCRLDHQSVVERFLHPFDRGEQVSEQAFLSAHPIELLDAIIRHSIGQHEYPPPREEHVASLPVIGDLWAGFRLRMQTAPTGLSKEEQLQQPSFIPHRPIKDPRHIRLLDPACGSMHFGLYAFDLLEVIYEEAWGMGVVPATDFGTDTPPFPHASVRLKPQLHQVHSNDTHGPIDAATARVVMLKAVDAGDGIFHCGPYFAPPGRNYRPGIAWEMPLADFDYQKALAEERLNQEEGERFVRETKCWDHDRADPLSPDEAKREFTRQIPALIIENNIHGIDIDPRAAQIAGFALWLRAQKAWQEMGLRPAERSGIRRSNIVCAEPMPGEAELLTAFVAESFPQGEQPFFQKLLDAVFEKMKLAGEAGSLLQIEEEIRFLVHEAREAWKRLGKLSGELFAEAEIVRGDVRSGTQLQLDLGSWSLDALSGIPDAEFWERAEGRIYSALKDFAEHADSTAGFQRRLFAEDAARGFAFIDLCRQRYDVALMNPPFGDASLPSKLYIEETYGDTKGDVYKAFVECFHSRLVPAGYLGIISSRTGFFLGLSEDWRTRVVLRLFRPIALADLGSGVLDAMVEVAAYVLRSLSEPEARDLTLSLVPVLEKVVRDKQDRFSLPKWQAARGDLKRHQAIAELEHLAAHGFIERCPGEIVRYTPFWLAVKRITAPPPSVYPSLVCVRALAEQDKGGVLGETIRNSSDPRKFICDPSGFARLPGSTFSYWATPRLVDAFTNLPKLADAGFEAWVGLQTNQDFRWLRLWWEINEGVSPATDNREEPRCWLPFAKGGEFAPVYCDIPLVVLWGRDGRLIKVWKKEQLRQGLITENNSQCWNESRYRRPGLTWPRRTNGLSFRVMPAGCIFGDKGPAVFSLRDEADDLLTILALLNSTVFVQMVGLMLARVSLAQSFEVGIVRAVPVPTFVASIREQLHESVCLVHRTRRELDAANGASHAFLAPSVLLVGGTSLAERAAAWAARVRTSEETVAAIQTEIDDLAFRLYSLDAADRAALTATLATEATSGAETATDEDEEEEASDADATALAADLLAYALGCAFGRWDIRFAIGERPAPEPPDPFDPLPVCPPGMLQNAAGLPAASSDVPADYPLRISWPGILVDDPHHPEDIGQRVREFFELLWPDRADAMEQEACALLGVKSLREYFRKPSSFFADHLKRYSKSRRQAPLYWPLSSPNGLYTVWLYYHRLNADTLFTVLRDYVKPLLGDEERRAFKLKQEAGPAPSPSQRRELTDAEDLVEDLRTLTDELTRVAPLFRPNLNDGVILNCAPLWRLMSLPKWQKDCKAAWDSLVNGDYDWSHLALHLWPDRVIPKCATDRSLAIAHGLEEIFWEEIPLEELKAAKPGKAPKRAKPATAPQETDNPEPSPEVESPMEPSAGSGKWRPKTVTLAEVQTLIATRTSPAIKAALEALAAAPVASGGKKGRKSSK